MGDFEGNVRRIVDGIERFIEANLRALEDVARASRGLTAIVGAGH